MKKVLTTVLLLGMSVFLIGCGQSKSEKIADAATRDYIRSSVHNTNELVRIHNELIAKKYDLEASSVYKAFLVEPIDTLLLQDLDDYKGAALDSYKKYLLQVVEGTKSLLKIE